MKLCVIPGDGIGREVIPCAVAVLKRVLPDLDFVEAEAGWDCFQRTGTALPEATLDAIRACGTALFGAVSSPAYKVEGYRSPIVHLRQALDLYANLRPTRTLWSAAARLGGRPQAVDLILVRENTQGLYSGRERMQGEEAIAERVITRAASERIGRVAFELARTRERKTVTIVHKANILPITDGLFRDSVRAVGQAYPEVAVNEMLVDTAAMMLASRPAQFDVIVTTNLFGDILSDVASVWGGGIGVAPSLNLGSQVAIAEPVHGSAPDIAGKGIANPSGAILSAALLARHYWHLPEVADRIERAVYAALESGTQTPDLGGQATTQALLAEVLRRL
ncbi:MAG: isocitrate/isopropylmalate dehydrogenase family protein [Anaerolineae bacterium]|nr:isocitrate/isopropylmalate dehydrogenase family protein [Anaerolineae bacterium]